MNAPTLSRIWRPQRFVVGFEHHPLRAAVQALLDEKRHAAHRDVLPLRASRSSPTRVRAPQTTRPDAGNERRQLMPSGFNSPFSGSVSTTTRSGTPDRLASRPAGAFQTPRSPSVLANTPAMAPLGAKSSIKPPFSTFGRRMRGKNTAAFLLGVLSVAIPLLAASLVFQSGGSMMYIARRSSQYLETASRKVELLSAVWNGGMQTRLTRSAWSSANRPLRSPAPVKSLSVSAPPSDPPVVTFALDVSSSNHCLPAGGAACLSGRVVPGNAGAFHRISRDSSSSTRSARRGLSLTLRFRNNSSSPVRVSMAQRLNRSVAVSPMLAA